MDRATLETVDDHQAPPANQIGTATAIDDSADADGDFAELQKRRSIRRRQDKAESRIQQIFPFQFSPNVRPLTISDLDSCVALENAAFSEEHRASPEKFEYRLTTCPELSLGLFCTVVPSQAKDFNIETLATAKPVESDRPDQALSVLLAHVVSTRSCTDVITDADMAYPKDWRTRGGRSAETGHQEAGRTVAVHSIAVSPKLQGCGLGQILIKSYIHQMNSSGVASRVSLLCQDYLVSYYERFGFKKIGESKATFGGGGWYDMIFELKGPEQMPYC